MLEIKPSPLSRLEIAQSPEYLPLIKSSILPFLKKPIPVGKWIAIEARLDHELVGLALSEVYPKPFGKTAELYSIIVKQSHRRQGIGRQLFSFTQNLLVKEEKVISFECVYTQEDPFTPALEKILASNGWEPAKTSVIRCHFDAYAFNPPWIRRSFTLPNSMQFFPWKELLLKDRRYIEHLAGQRRFLPYLNPLRKEEFIDLDTSVGLRRNGCVAGWCITKRPDPATIRYSILYIDSELLQKGYGIQLLVESIRRQKQLPIPKAIFEVNVKEIDPSWSHFIKKRLMPLACKVEHIKHPFLFFNNS